ncbi:MAG: hypothetical protein JWM09_706 [Francisellaceae bacterium]|nr:hypothetical protein [Francisellaceae bacterium]
MQEIELARAFFHNLVHNKDWSFIKKNSLVDISCDLPIGKGENIEKIWKVCQDWNNAFTDANFVVKDFFKNNNKIALQWMCSSIHSGIYKGQNPTGKLLNFNGTTFITLNNKKLQKIFTSSDFFQVFYENTQLVNFTPREWIKTLLSQLQPLTLREIQILCLWISGVSLKKTASILGNVSSRTIETHRENIKVKLQANNKIQLFNLVRQRDLNIIILKYTEEILKL